MIKLITAKEGTVAVLKRDQNISRWIEEVGSIRTDGTIEAVLPLIKPGDVVVDGGGNVGGWTVPFSQAVGPTGRVYTFEPMPFSFACLTVNTRDLDNVAIYNFGLGGSVYVAKLGIDDNAGASHINHVRGVPVVIAPLGAIVDFERLDLIKLDIEGCEYFALLGAVELLKKFRPKVVCEINHGALERQSCTAKSLIAFMEGLDYEMTFLDPRHTLDLAQTDVLFTPKL